MHATRFSCYCCSVLPPPSLGPSPWPSRSGQTTSVVVEVAVTVIRARPKPRFFTLPLNRFFSLPSHSPATNGCHHPPLSAHLRRPPSPSISLKLSPSLLCGLLGRGSWGAQMESPPCAFFAKKEGPSAPSFFFLPFFVVFYC